MSVVAVDVAVSKMEIKHENKALQALTSAALVLPGLIAAPVEAMETESIDFQYSHYQEGKRTIIGVPNNRDPIEVETIHLSSQLTLTERINFAFDYIQDTWSGATPVTTSPVVAGGNAAIEVDSENGLTTVGASPIILSEIAFDQDLKPLQFSIDQDQLVDDRVVHVLSSASPETRKQGNFKLGYQFDNAELDLLGGISLENDFESYFGGLNGRWDLNQKLTSLKAGFSYTDNYTAAIIDHDTSPYITKTAFKDQIIFRGGSEIFKGRQQSWAGTLGVTQILNKNALFDANFSYTHSSGFLENPYKLVTVIFIDPESLNNAQGIITGNVQSLQEQRPDSRNQWAISGKYIQYINPLKAALHLNYQFSIDDWGINAHSMEAQWVQPLWSGWTITPRMRYYSQSSAKFYQPYLTSNQAFRQIAVDENGREIWVDSVNPDNGIEYFRDDNFNLVDEVGNLVDESTLNIRNKNVPFDPKKLPDNFSSDHRLSGFGSLSGGIILSKKFTRGINLEAGFEYYTHAGDLKLGGGGEGSYADFDFFVASAGIKVNLSAISSMSGDHLHHSTKHQQHNHNAPAGLSFSHMISEADSWMIGYKFMYGNREGSMLHGSQSVSDQEIVANACSKQDLCRFTMADMNMSMHMLNIMYAPTDWLNLMLMPQFVEKDMHIRELEGRPPARLDTHEHTGIGGHATGGVGDTSLVALFKLWETPKHKLHMGMGVSMPTGDVELEFRRVAREDGGIVHFGMQLGSGTWDLLPSITYNGMQDDWSWGAQISGTARLGNRNTSGYRLGDLFQGTAWGNYNITPWLSASIRGIYTAKGSIKGDFNTFNRRSGPMDFPANYGGRFWDIGFGVSARMLQGDLAGNSVSFEWLQPVSDDFNGYQLERDGALTAAWSYAF